MDQPAQAQPEVPGRLIVVVGPSGAGKDTLMAYAARQLQGRDDVVFVRRVITRDGEAGGEEHEAVCEADFQQMAEAGEFAVSWEAHGLHYGIPADALKQVTQGHLVIANGSRSALPRFATACPSMTVINITARLEVLAERLEARGRESRDEILRRLQRSSPELSGEFDVVTIDNSGSIEDAGQAMVAALMQYLAVPQSS
ncbi:ribose 1,5-bisphosphokinase [Pseudorhizobium tarimense]|uniref:Ribose 1,5-bisphosphate phosphokinase PhnN n=1 Tax=Pseudorhizobium tarimense TaxID=1079109 RepID=A0ABV2H242_9HYPH|nr:phosphonate metabolism protein/1,5-bisphosphokinase (PRPP-forming) PhnN [Pseudorhizobium tarimense]MCJ8517859.1 phosphonate metabolism protein/1,5-bisphosphokinase (PRPP-forming) PhnN [Pseudorhizobium tarimense]